VLDGLRHSYVDLDDPSHLEFAYTSGSPTSSPSSPEGPLDVLHLGGGGFTVPRHLAAVRPGSRSTVLEVDPQIPEIGRGRSAGHRRRPRGRGRRRAHAHRRAGGRRRTTSWSATPSAALLSRGT
jgi:hypothetical protein